MASLRPAPHEIYSAQNREDSLVERALVAEHEPRRIACIGSGGCTALSLLTDDVERLYAIDGNVAQCALLELKKEALRALPRADYLAFIGEAAGVDRLDTYRRLAPALPVYARLYWDDHPAEIRLGINQCGATERFHRFVGESLRKSVCGERVLHELLDCDDVAAQRALYERHFTTESWASALRVLLSRTTHMLFFPAVLFAQATEDDRAAFFSRQFAHEVRTKPLSGNYFLSQLLFSSYRKDRREGAPHYLSARGYAAAQRNVDKLAVVPGTLQEFLPRAERIDAFFLSNVFDGAGPEDRRRICEAVLRAKARRAVVLYRSRGEGAGLPAFFEERLHKDEARNARLREVERSMLYQQVTAADLR